MIKYAIYKYKIEKKTNKGEEWTEEDLINGFYDENQTESIKLGEFDSLEKAEAVFELEKRYLKPYYEHGTAHGFVIEYEVIELVKIETDDDGEEEDYRTIKIAAR